MTRALPLLLCALGLAACGPGSATRASDPDRGADVETGPVEAELRRFPGVEVRETADGVEVRVRGDTSFMANQEPLYIVDGTRRDASMGGGLVGIRRADIVDIRVLKSASETSAYGPRGANGVVLITTRNAAR
ncbi:hypothetical protein [Rubrivirga sp.]|uniref:hypothetical protein n=1 Tax=Rubrivirga sp. TaxID=1885344 RepID=UPI003B5247F2